jgi:hypothetical protein
MVQTPLVKSALTADLGAVQFPVRGDRAAFPLSRGLHDPAAPNVDEAIRAAQSAVRAVTGSELPAQVPAYLMYSSAIADKAGELFGKDSALTKLYSNQPYDTNMNVPMLPGGKLELPATSTAAQTMTDPQSGQTVIVAVPVFSGATAAVDVKSVVSASTAMTPVAAASSVLRSPEKAKPASSKDQKQVVLAPPVVESTATPAEVCFVSFFCILDGNSS